MPGIGALEIFRDAPICPGLFQARKTQARHVKGKKRLPEGPSGPARDTTPTRVGGVRVARKDRKHDPGGGLGSLYARGLTDQKSARSAAYHAHNVHEALDTLSLSAITSSTLARYCDRQLAQGYAAQTVKHDLSLISHGLNICIKEWGIALPAGNPITQVKRPSLASRPRSRLVAVNGPLPGRQAQGRGYCRFATILTVIFLITGKLDFSQINPHITGQPT